jgi:hypothetical protein
MPATNWWVHRYVQVESGIVIRTFVINHSATAPGSEATSPGALGYPTIEQAEVALGFMGDGFGSNWYIQRVGKATASTRYYKVHHTAGDATCPSPAGGGYATTLELANGLHLSSLHNGGICDPPP